MTKPIEPRVQSVGTGCVGDGELKKGFSSSSTSCFDLLVGNDFESHSQSQHNRLRSSISKLVLKPVYVTTEIWLRTFRTIPESEVGEIAQVANACERASCNALCRLYNLESSGGRGRRDVSVIRVFVGGGVRGLVRKNN